jgi:cytoskeletal protein CcmA (bactofilin family)
MTNRIHRIETIVGKGSRIAGDMSVNGSTHIAGTVEGNITASGFVTVADTGVVKGGLTGEYAIIGGVVGGDVSVKGKLVLGKGAKLDGDIIASRLIIEEGAIFQGRSTMIEAPVEEG